MQNVIADQMNIHRVSSGYNREFLVFSKGTDRISIALAWELGSGPHPQGTVATLHISLRNLSGGTGV